MVILLLNFERFASDLKPFAGMYAVLTVVFAGVAWLVYQRLGNGATLVMHTFTAALLGVAAVGLYSDTEGWTFVAFVSAIIVLALVLWRLPHRLLAVLLHGLALILALWISVRIGSDDSAESFITWARIATLFGIGALALGAATARDTMTKAIYWTGAHLFVLAWLAQMFSEQQGWVSIAWGVYALLLLVVSLVRDMAYLQLAALITIGVIVAKLFIVDLSGVQAIWRVLLFLGVGLSLLVMSYFYRVLARSSAE